MSLTGTWNISISTPIGTQSVVLELTENDGVIEGIAKGNAESTPLINPVLDGNRPVSVILTEKYGVPYNCG